MQKTNLFLIMDNGGQLVLTDQDMSTPLKIAISTDYIFDDDVRAKLAIYDTKERTTNDDPLHHLEWVIDFVDVLSNQTIESVRGRLFTGGGIDELSERYNDNASYAIKKLDYHGTLKGNVFDVESSYDKNQAKNIIGYLSSLINSMGSYRKSEKVFELPLSTSADSVVIDSELLVRQLIDLDPNYIALTNIDDLGMIDVVGEVVERQNCHAFIELGEIKSVNQAVALANSLNINDHRIRLLLNATISRSRNSVLSKKSYRPCVGDYLAKHLIRNYSYDNNGIPPIHIPVAGYDFPVEFSDMEMADGMYFDAESENMLAEAGVIVLKSERYDSDTRFVYADILTQKNSDSSALRLANASEISTYVDKGVIGIIKRHLLTPMSYFQSKVYNDCVRFLDACVAAGLIMPSRQLGGRYYALSISENAQKPFEAVDVKMTYRPEGAVRQAYLETTISK